MDRKQILSAIKSLALSKGFYGRLYNKLIDGSEESEEALFTMEQQNFTNVCDLVMWLEC